MRTQSNPFMARETLNQMTMQCEKLSAALKDSKLMLFGMYATSSTYHEVVTFIG